MAQKANRPLWAGLIQNSLPLHLSTGPTNTAFEVAGAQMYLSGTWPVFTQVHSKVEGENFCALGRTDLRFGESTGFLKDCKIATWSGRTGIIGQDLICSFAVPVAMVTTSPSHG